MSEQTIEPDSSEVEELVNVPLEPAGPVAHREVIIEDVPVENTPATEAPVKENRPAFVLHKFEKAAQKEFRFTGQDLLMYGIGILGLMIAAYIYGRMAVVSQGVDSE
jgi:hypothetical protein